MRTLPGRAAAFALTLLLSVTVLTTGAYAWEKEQQALNDIMERDDTVYTPIEVELPVIRKEIEGENVPSKTFYFVLEGKSGAPMPEGSSGSCYTVDRIGKGSVSLGSINFEKPGTYIYTIYETEDSDINWTYDDAEYTLTITVEKDGTVLIAEDTLKKDGKTEEKIIFTNTYEEIDLNEKITIDGQKTWDHGNNPEENRPDHIIVTIYANGKLFQQKEVTQETDWAYSFTVPKYTKEGKEIRYTADEVDVTDYQKEIHGYDITNTYVGTPVEDPTENPSSPVKPSKPPKTGDEFPLTLWLILGMTGLCGFVFMMILLSKTKTIYRGKRLKGKA